MEKKGTSASPATAFASGSGRAYKQRALWHGSADLPVFFGIVQKINDFGKKLLCLVLARHVGKFDAGGGFDIYLGVAFAKRHRPAGAAAHHALVHLPEKKLTEGDKQDRRKDEADQNAHKRRLLRGNLADELRAGAADLLDKLVARIDQTGFADLGFPVLFNRIKNHIILQVDLDFFDLVGIQTVQKIAVGGFHNAAPHQPWQHKNIEHKHDDEGDNRVGGKHLLGFLVVIGIGCHNFSPVRADCSAQSDLKVLRRTVSYGTIMTRKKENYN